MTIPSELRRMSDMLLDYCVENNVAIELDATDDGYQLVQVKEHVDDTFSKATWHRFSHNREFMRSKAL